MDPLRETAIHEAGHAVARWWLDRTQFLGRGYIFPDLDHVAVMLDEGEALYDARGFEVPASVGICAADALMQPAIERIISKQAPPHINTPARRRFLRQAAAADCAQTMAGPIAEHLARGEPLADWADWHQRIGEEDFAEGHEEGTDHWRVWQRQPFLGRRWRLHLQRAFETADHIVRRHQPHIEALAAALALHGEIDGEEVYRLFDDAGPAVKRLAPGRLVRHPIEDDPEAWAEPER